MFTVRGVFLYSTYTHGKRMYSSRSTSYLAEGMRARCRGLSWWVTDAGRCWRWRTLTELYVLCGTRRGPS